MISFLHDYDIDTLPSLFNITSTLLGADKGKKALRTKWSQPSHRGRGTGGRIAFSLFFFSIPIHGCFCVLTLLGSVLFYYLLMFIQTTNRLAEGSALTLIFMSMFHLLGELGRGVSGMPVYIATWRITGSLLGE